MATLERPVITSNVIDLGDELEVDQLEQAPEPFPMSELVELRGELGNAEAQLTTPKEQVADDAVEVLNTLLSVQHSCTIALNSLLFHAVPQPKSQCFSSLSETSLNDLPLVPLLANLRATEDTVTAVTEDQSAIPTTEASLAREVEFHVLRLLNCISEEEDKDLALSLSELLVSTAQLFTSAGIETPSGLNSALSSKDASPVFTRLTSSDMERSSSDPFASGQSSAGGVARNNNNPYSSLKEQVKNLQFSRRRSSTATLSALGAASTSASNKSIKVVQTELIWTRIDTLLEVVHNLCREKIAGPFFGIDEDENHDGVDHDFDEFDLVSDPGTLPPGYEDLHLYRNISGDNHLHLPTYDPPSALGVRSPDMKQQPSASTAATMQHSHSNEKLRADFESVTSAIDRLYQVAPQLSNQRAELKPSPSFKPSTMTRGEMSDAEMDKMIGRGKMSDQVADGSKIFIEKRKGKRRNVAEQEEELGRIWDRIERAHGQRLDAQSSRGPNQAKILTATEANQGKFINGIAEIIGASRLSDQDAYPTTRLLDQTEPITVNEFIKELHRPASSSPGSSSSCSPKNMPLNTTNFQQSNANANLEPSGDTAASYISEFQESIKTIQVVFTLATRWNHIDGGDLKAEVNPTDPTKLSIKSSSGLFICSMSLPGEAVPGQSNLKVFRRDGYYELKLAGIPLSHFRTSLPSSSTLGANTIYSAPDLTNSPPSSFQCSMCRQRILGPLVNEQGQSRLVYRDLPSEHWTELMDAWMCHAEQKLDVDLRFFPRKGEVLVGGGYFLVEGGDVRVDSELELAGGDETAQWQSMRCRCGETTAQRITHLSDPPTYTYRFPKYAISPFLKDGSELLKTNLSMFVTLDMLDLVNVHRTYRFLIADEDNGKEKIMIWLFNPSITISTNNHDTPRSFKAAKVFFKVLPEEATIASQLVSTFSRSSAPETLSYPLEVCDRIGKFLHESNLAYPQPRRAAMEGLDLGWIERL